MSNDNIIQIAVIDGNAQLRDMSVKQFTDAGFTVLFQADNGLQALERITSDGLPDVCIVEEDFATAKLLLEKHPDLKILISSTQDDTESITDMLKAGVSGYILKFADPNEMLTAVKVLSENKKDRKSVV